MKKSDDRIRKYLFAGKSISCNGSGIFRSPDDISGELPPEPISSVESVSCTESSQSCLRETIRLSKAAFYEMESREQLSSAEFVYQQSQYIRKRWWILQGGLLVLLWILLVVSESGIAVRKSMGAAAPLFAVLLLPELWKNRNARATEIEGTAFYSLRQIYAARIFLFAMADFLMLDAFFAATVLTGKMLPEEVLLQFLLPYSITCCICFGTLYSRRIVSETFALLVCSVWCILWIRTAADEKMYGMISVPAALAVTAAAVFYSGYFFFRGQKGWRNLYMVRETT